jgi:hypothetical protein
MNKECLLGPKRRVIELCQAVNFGRISFRVRGGEPDADQPWRTLRTVKVTGGRNGPRPESCKVDFELRKEQIALLDELSCLADSTRVTVEVKHGLPFIIQIEDEHNV